MQDEKVLKARTPSKTSARRRFTIISPPLSVVLCTLSSIGQRLEHCLQIHLLWAKGAKQPRRDSKSHHPSPSINQQHNNHERMQTPWSSTSTGKNLGFGSSRPFGLPLPGRLRRNCRDGHGLHVHGHTASGTDLRDHRLRHPPIAWISHSSQMAENCGEDTNAPTNAIKQVVPITTVIGRRLIRHS